MLNGVTNLIERLIVKAELTARALLRASAGRRIERLYGNLPQQTAAPRRDGQNQAAILAGIVRSHCETGKNVIEVQAAAAIKIGSAEYTLSMMLEELRDVMSAPPTVWLGPRDAFTPEPSPVAEAIVRAA